MKVNLLNFATNDMVRAGIRSAKIEEMPSIADKWHFNFRKYFQNKGKMAFVLAREETPEIIEGCMIFSLNQTLGPYMDLLEVAPHNKGVNGLNKRVAGCLIAFACGLSFEFGKNEDKGILTFEVNGKSPSAKNRLEKLYTEFYVAKANPFGFMEIYPDEGKRLMDQFLRLEMK